jgi:hypothetical protein
VAGFSTITAGPWEEPQITVLAKALEPAIQGAAADFGATLLPRSFSLRVGQTGVEEE